MEKRIHYISVCKGIAILMIIAVHGAQPFVRIPDLIRRVSIYGQMGTQLFFVISGFLMANHMTKSKDDSYCKYLLTKYKRFIVPITIISLIYFIVFSLDKNVLKLSIYDPNYTLLNFALQAVMMQNVNPIGVNSLFPGSWYLNCLWFFYLIAPIVYKSLQAMTKKNKAIFPISLFIYELLVCFVQWLLYHYTSIKIGNNSFFYFSFFNQLPSFCIGILYNFWQKEKSKYDSLHLSFLLCLLWTVITALILFINKSFSFVICVVTSSFSFFWLINLVRLIEIKNSNSTIFKALSNLGDSSLGIYMTHILYVWYIPTFLLKYLNIQSSYLHLLLYIILLFTSGFIVQPIGKLFEDKIQLIFNKLG